VPADCLFCRIIAGDEPASIMLDSPDVVAFLDTRPLFKGHTLVCPRRHVATLDGLPDALVVPLFGAAQRVATAMRDVLGAQGSFVAINNVVTVGAAPACARGAADQR